MKTENVSGNRNAPYQSRGNAQKGKETKPAPEEKSDHLVKNEKPHGEFKKTTVNDPKKVGKHINETIKWREMKFYQREQGGQMYVDIIDKKTGNVIRTVPDNEFSEIAAKFKHLSGMTLNISG